MRYACSLKYGTGEELVELSFASVFERSILFLFFLIHLAISEAKNENVYPQFSVACSKPHFRTRRKLS